SLPKVLIEFAHSLHADVSIPESSGPQMRDIRLLIAIDAQQHDLDPIPPEAGIDVGFGFRKKAGTESKLAFIPFCGRSDIAYQEGGSCREKLGHRIAPS